MSYVLVSRTADDATSANDGFARWFAESHPPSAAFHEGHPDHLQGQNSAEELRRAVSRGAVTGRGVVFGALPIERGMASLRVLA